MTDWNIGLAQVDYTPELGLPLMGNFRDDYGARGVHDRLYSRALVFQDAAGAKLALLSVDICMMGRENVALMRRFIASETDLRPEDIIIAATHTHSGPAAMNLGSLPKADDAAIERFLTKAATAAIEANQRIKPSRLALGTATEDRVSFNRRLRCKDGKTHMNWEGLDPEFVVAPLGPVDPQLLSLTIEQDGRPVAALVNFALHPAILAGDNWLYSADYPAYLAESLSRLHGGGFITFFFNGCCGNVNHLDYKDKTQGRGYQMAQRVGYMLGVAASEAERHSVPVGGSELALSGEKVRLKRFLISEDQRKWAEEVMKNIGEHPARGQVDGLPDAHYALTWLKMHALGEADDFVEVRALRIGDVGIVALPGEVFCEFGLQIKRESPARHTLVIELANDEIGYLPTREAFEQGGYEPAAGSTFYQAGAGEEITASALRQLNKLFSR